MSSQRFCLRWNNHQTNLLSVFDQLLHAGTFIDVTLVVEGQFLKAHKMVLSACSPYFQAIFVNHPEKHPIVILKDVPYNDMKCLLDFMYRGEVSVDQDRLAAFLRVAESLRIKGLTEVNDDKPPPPTASLTGPGSGTTTTGSSGAVNQSQSQPNQLQQQLVAAATRNTQLAALQQSQQLLQQKQQKSGQSMLLTNPLLGSALSQQKRKRGRPRKLSGSDTGGDGEYEGYESDSVVQGSPELVEAKMGADGHSNSGDENVISRSEDPDQDDSMDVECPQVMNNNNNNNNNNNSSSKNASSNPASSGPTTATSTKSATNINAATNSTSNVKSSASSLKNENSMSDLADNPEITIIPQVTKPAALVPVSESERSPMEADDAEDADDDEDEEERDDSDSELEFILPPKYEPSDDCTIVEAIPPTEQQDKDLQHSAPSSHQAQPNSKQQQQQLFLHQLQQQHFQHLQLQRRSLAKVRVVHGRKGENGDSNGGLTVGSDPEDRDLGSPDTSASHGTTPSQDSFEESNGNHSHYTPMRQPARRRARRKNLSPDDQAEALTEMSVRGLNLFRYASINDGVYLCMECAKENIQKTFKNKYSFQRHAFLYHEGAQRKVFPCPVCNKEFSRPDKMKNHLKTTHESYMPKTDPVYPMNFMVAAEQSSQLPPNHNTNTAKIESVLNAIQLQQHINLQNELHSQQSKFRLQQQLISPKLGDAGVVPTISAVAASNSSQ
ncbi:protein tramtrack, alpha isoform isoform X2 [Malaya genurostris]|uniref:protein tramtrack, alpha isoform isoform X2 n=1 Tax=Malaya genurostris TaxID=325434 RepID=UPI0026F3F7B9|nr:protein tramtrack, alpha isoform isoform X2 [Malaya genurostris]